MSSDSKSQSTLALVARNVVRSFPTPAEALVVLDGVSLELETGATLSIVGPSGCGKSTLLHIFGTLDRPTSGEVFLRGADPFALSEPELAGFRNREIGFVFQDHHLLPQLNVLENVLMPTLASDVNEEEEKEVLERALNLLDRVGLKERSMHVPAELSGGERQRAAIARALIMKPSLLLCDEPTGNLDPRTAGTIGDLLQEVHQNEGVVLVVVTHSRTLADRFDQRAQLEEGKLTLS